MKPKAFSYRLHGNVFESTFNENVRSKLYETQQVNFNSLQSIVKKILHAQTLLR